MANKREESKSGRVDRWTIPSHMQLGKIFLLIYIRKAGEVHQERIVVGETM